MKIVSFIYEHRVIKKILAHRGLLQGGRTKTRSASTCKEMFGSSVEPFDDGWPEYEELYTVVQG